MSSNSTISLRELAEKSIRELETENGILASSRSEIYGCIFGRDSLITSLALLKVYAKTRDEYYLSLVRKVLINLAALQGKEVNIESGEEPGKMIHEYRPEYHEHLTIHTVHMQKPWYLYPDNVMRNYDTADATALFLMAAHVFLRESKNGRDVVELLPPVRAALAWMRDYGDINGDGLFDYHMHPERTHGGLVTQSWMDSSESVFFEDRVERPHYPIAPVEVQAYSFVALRAWADFFVTRDATLSLELSGRADTLKKKFNEKFVIEGKRGEVSLAFALDGTGEQLTAPRSSMGHCLFAVWRAETGAMPESVVNEKYIPAVARRLLKPDLYVPRGGIRTLSRRSSRFDARSYHNGSIWPHDTYIVADGLDNFGFREEAKRVRAGLMSAYTHFNTPLELFVYDRGKYREYCDPRGQGACRIQAWSAASLLAALTEE